MNARLRQRSAWLTLLFPILGVGCIAPSAEEEARQAELLVRTLFEARASGDAFMAESLFWPEATFDDFANQHTYQGVTEIISYLTSTHDWADDVFWNVGQVHGTTDGAVVEWVFSAVQARPMSGQVTVGTGREVVTNGVTILELRGDRIIRGADYLDALPLMLQLGGRMELPGGTTLEQDGQVGR